MGMKEKLIQIAENEQKVYEAGQQSMVDKNKIIEKTANGSIVSLDDISEVPHEVSVQLSSDTVTDFSGVEMTVIGENLFDAKKYPLIVGREIWATSGSMTYGNPVVCGTEAFIPCNLLRGKTITILHTTSIGVQRGIAFYDDNKTYISGIQNNNGIKLTATIPDNATYYRFCMDVTYIDVAQIYETNNKKTYTTSTDGALTIKSASPNMYIATETDGINISVTYHKSWGMQTEYDRFWDNFQNYNDIMNALYAFSGPAWNDNTYNPKGTIIKATKFTNMFRNANITNTKVTLDLTEGVGTYLFHTAENLTTVPKIIVNENIQFTGWLVYCRKLVTILFEGIIASSLDIHWSINLSYESVESIFNCLGGTASATLTLPTSHNDGRYDNLIANMPSNWAVAWL